MPGALTPRTLMGFSLSVSQAARNPSTDADKHLIPLAANRRAVTLRRSLLPVASSSHLREPSMFGLAATSFQLYLHRVGTRFRVSGSQIPGIRHCHIALLRTALGNCPTLHIFVDVLCEKCAKTAAP